VTFHHDLLDQATHLAKREPKKPKQARLRRSLSAVYYALFHMLVAYGASLLAPARPLGLRSLVQRTFNHGDMRRVCNALLDGHKAALMNRSTGTQPIFSRQLITLPLDPGLFAVIKAFVDLQEARHEADYNLEKQWTRYDVEARIEIVRTAMGKWATTRRKPDSDVFLTALLLQKHWGRS